MFKSTKEFDQSVCALLKKIIADGMFVPDESRKDDNDYWDIVEYSINNGLVAGLSGYKTQNGKYHTSNNENARITRSGLSIIERMNRSQ